MEGTRVRLHSLARARLRAYQTELNVHFRMCLLRGRGEDRAAGVGDGRRSTVGRREASTAGARQNSDCLPAGRCFAMPLFPWTGGVPGRAVERLPWRATSASCLRVPYTMIVHSEKERR